MKDEEQPLAVELLNTLREDRHGVRDALDGEPAVRDWLAAMGEHKLTSDDVALLGTVARSGELDANRFRLLRDALRSVAARVAGQTPACPAVPDIDPDRAPVVLNELAEAAPWWFELRWSDGVATRVRRSTATGGHALLARLAEDGIELFSGASGRELLACAAPGCWQYFTRTDSRRQWCSTACGNRARVARHYSRHRPVQPRPTEAGASGALSERA